MKIKNILNLTIFIFTSFTYAFSMAPQNQVRTGFRQTTGKTIITEEEAQTVFSIISDLENNTEPTMSKINSIIDMGYSIENLKEVRSFCALNAPAGNQYFRNIFDAIDALFNDKKDASGKREILNEINMTINQNLNKRLWKEIRDELSIRFSEKNIESCETNNLERIIFSEKNLINELLLTKINEQNFRFKDFEDDLGSKGFMKIAIEEVKNDFIKEEIRKINVEIDSNLNKTRWYDLKEELLKNYSEESIDQCLEKRKDEIIGSDEYIEKNSDTGIDNLKVEMFRKLHTSNVPWAKLVIQEALFLASYSQESLEKCKTRLETIIDNIEAKIFKEFIEKNIDNNSLEQIKEKLVSEIGFTQENVNNLFNQEAKFIDEQQKIASKKKGNVLGGFTANVNPENNPQTLTANPSIAVNQNAANSNNQNAAPMSEAQKARLERIKALEKQKEEKERLDREKVEKETREKEEQERARIEKETREKHEQEEELKAIRQEVERKKQLEREEKERLENQKAEQEKREKEEQEKARLAKEEEYKQKTLEELKKLQEEKLEQEEQARLKLEQEEQVKIANEKIRLEEENKRNQKTLEEYTKLQEEKFKKEQDEISIKKHEEEKKPNLEPAKNTDEKTSIINPNTPPASNSNQNGINKKHSIFNSFKNFFGSKYGVISLIISAPIAAFFGYKFIKSIKNIMQKHNILFKKPIKNKWNFLWAPFLARTKTR